MSLLFSQDDPIYIAAASWAKRSESEHLFRAPSFRKATIPMAIAWQAVRKTLDQLPLYGDTIMKTEWGLSLGTSHGELEVTRDFLVTLENKGLARPILFQNSLHHSTLGFISLRLGSGGPGMTVSNHFFSGEDALSTAVELIRTGECDCALAIAVDALVEKLEPALSQHYPSGSSHDEGSGCVLLVNKKGLATLGKAPVAILSDLTYYSASSDDIDQQSAVVLHSDYDSDAIEKLARVLSESSFADNTPKTITLKKPDGTFSKIALRTGMPSCQ